MDRIEPTLGELPAEPDDGVERRATPRRRADDRLGGLPPLAGFGGRLSPLRYLCWWLFFLFLLPLVGVGLTAAGATVLAVAGPGWYWPLMALGLLVGVAVAGFQASVVVRRLHDLDLSGWWALVALAPVLNLVFLLGIGLARGSAGANRFGAANPPAGPLLWLVFVVLLLVPAGLLALKAGLPLEPPPVGLELPR